jgi:FKBP-type peptidyl-prolyl cis-trans isomerase 2
VRLHYTARFSVGTLLASSVQGDPLDLVAGGDEVIEGLSEAVVGMRAGESKRILVPPEKGFGVRDPALVRRVPLTEMPERVRPGDQLSAEGNGWEMPVWVRSIEQGFAVLDGNHPLAGQSLIFEFEVLSDD